MCIRDRYCLDALPLLLEGLLFTLIIFAIIVAIGFPLSVVVASLKTIGPKWLRRILGVYTWIFRGTPLLLQLFLVYYALPHLGIVLSPNTVIIIVYLLSVTAYESEVIRGGMAGIDNGQYLSLIHIWKYGMAFCTIAARECQLPWKGR